MLESERRGGVGLNSRDIDITGNITAIEGLKVQLLDCITRLYKSLIDGEATTRDRSDILADLVIITYVLSDRLGVSYQGLDMRILKHLRLGILEENSSEEWHRTLSDLSQYLANRNS